MPYTLNGFGTKYYGKREPAEDGSYITTLWITALYVPVLPLGSYRVRPVGKGVNYGVHVSQNYQVMKVPFCWEQIWRIYMIGAPILILVGWFVWTDIQKDNQRGSVRAQITAAGRDIETARDQSDKLESACLDSIKAARARDEKDREIAFRTDVNDHCAPLSVALDSYGGKIDIMQGLIGKALSVVARDTERSELITYQSVWKLRRHQADETKEMVTCMQDASGDCPRRNMSPLTASMDQEDKQVCTLLAQVHEKCE